MFKKKFIFPTSTLSKILKHSSEKKKKNCVVLKLVKEIIVNLESHEMFLIEKYFICSINS